MRRAVLGAGARWARWLLAVGLLCTTPLACGAPEAEQTPISGGDAEHVAASEQAPAEPGGEPAPAPLPEKPAAPKPPPKRVPAPPSPPLVPEAAPADVPAAAPDAASLDLAALERRLRATRALGPLTKLALKNDIDDLVADLRAYHAQGRGDLSRLRERFELLVMKLLSLLQDREAELAAQIASSREALWTLLSDPRAFARLSETK